MLAPLKAHEFIQNNVPVHVPVHVVSCPAVAEFEKENWFKIDMLLVAVRGPRGPLRICNRPLFSPSISRNKHSSQSKSRPVRRTVPKSIKL